MSFTLRPSDKPSYGLRDTTSPIWVRGCRKGNFHLQSLDIRIVKPAFLHLAESEEGVLTWLAEDDL